MLLFDIQYMKLQHSAHIDVINENIIDRVNIIQTYFITFIDLSSYSLSHLFIFINFSYSVSYLF